MTDQYVAKTPDRVLLALLIELKDTFGSDHLVVDLGGVNLTERDFESVMKRPGPTYFIHSFHWNSGQTKVTVSMNRAQFPPGFNPAFYDVITLAPQPQRANLADVLGVDEILKKHLRYPKPGDAREIAKDTRGIIDKETAALAQLHHTMLENAEMLRVRYDEDAANRRTQFEQQQLNAEEDLRRREAESLERIQSERLALEEKLREFDQSDHMFARRKLREDITGQVQEFITSPMTSRQSSTKFSFMLALCLMSALGAGALAFESFQSFVSLAQASGVSGVAAPAPADVVTKITGGQTTYLLWMLAIRGAVSSAVAVGFAVYLISMLRKSYDSEVRTLHEYRRYGMDINRASWVIETAMEMTTKEGATLPERWIEGACAGLFQADTRKDNEVSSLAALGAVMGLGPEVSIGPTGASFKIPPKGSKKAAKEEA